jgi:hypothetical protein
MATDDTAGSDRKGIWLWAIFSAVTLFFVEFILFAAFIPTHWARQVSETETRWLVEQQGEASAQAIIGQAEGWYRTLFVDTGIEPWTYHILAPGKAVKAEPGWEGLAENQLWDWTRGRLNVLWGSFGQALQRIALLLSWLPFLAILLVAAIGDGWIRRRIRRHSSAYASPLLHHSSVVGDLVLWVLITLLLLAPIPIPAVAVPLTFAASAVLVNLAVTNTQKRL